MEPEKHDKNRQPVLNFKCEKILTCLGNSNSTNTKSVTTKEKYVTETNEEVFGSPTPDKFPQLSRRSKKLEEIELPYDFQVVGELFDGLETSVRLLHLCNKPVIFQNVCKQVEILSKRKFLYNHLSQMKYVMPEYIHVEKIFVHDPECLCMLPDLKISLLRSTSCKTDMFITSPGNADSKPLRDVFWTRLREIFVDHPEVANIPEATLPAPFNSSSNVFPKEASILVTSGSSPSLSWTCSSHFSSSFQQKFSNKVKVPQELKTPLLLSSALNSIPGDTSDRFRSPVKQHNEFEQTGSSQNSIIIIEPHLGQCSLVEHPPTPAQTLSKIAAQKTPQGPAQIRTLVHLNPRRSLKFTLENAGGSDSKQILSLNKENRERSYPIYEFQKLVGPPVDEQVSGRILPAIRQQVPGNRNKMTLCEAYVAKQEKMQAYLPKLFSTICRIVQSAKYPYFTKSELLHKILLYSSEMLETSEIEEQLKLLEELAPEWITQQTASSGDFLYCISKGLDVSAIYARLVEAM